MAQPNAEFKCQSCGNIVEFLHDGKAPISCCGAPMTHLEENTEDAAQEKHVPVIEKIPGGVRVTVGEVEHPMLDAHYIEWIEVLAGPYVYRKQLQPDEKPVAEFMVDASDITARAYCNLHGLWKA